MDVALHDRLADPVGPPVLDVTGFLPATVFAQAGSGGTLVDREGTDSYLLSLENTARAGARSDRAPGVPRTTVFTNGQGGTGQGAGGYGAPGTFLDLAGDGDRIESVARSYVATAPDPDGAFLWPGVWPTVQGAGAASTFAVLGTSPVITSSPSRPACPGALGAYRGFGRWTECPVGFREDHPQHQSFDIPRLGTPSNGTATGASGSPISISITPDTPASAAADPNEAPTPDGLRIPVGARVVDASGTPLAGETVHFGLQIDFDDCWPVVWQVDAVTDDDGVARARLPLLKTGLQPQGPWRVAATFDGGPGRYPAHTAVPITLTG